MSSQRRKVSRQPDFTGSIFVFLLSLTSVRAATTSLYDGIGSYSSFGNIDSADGDVTGQQFNPSNAALPNHLLTTDVFDRAALHISIDPNTPVRGDPGYFQMQVRFWVWNTNFATTIAGPPLADTGTLTLPGGFDGWTEISFPPQTANGTYLIGITRLGFPINGQWILERTSANSAAVDSVAYQGNGTPASTASALADREFALRLHSYAGSCEPSVPHVRVTSLSGNVGAANATSAVLTLHGSNLDTVTAASLIRRHSNNNPNFALPLTVTISTTTLGGTATDRTATFNLAAANGGAGAEGGAYDLVLTTNTCDRVDNAKDFVLNDNALVAFQNAFIVYMPSLANSSFENAWDPSLASGGFWNLCSNPTDRAANRNVAEAQHWCSSISMPLSVFNAWMRDGDQSPPTFGTCSTAHGYDPKLDGVHFANLKMNHATSNARPGRTAIFQTIVPPVTPNAVTGQPIHRGFYVTISYRTAADLQYDQAVFRLRDGTNIFTPIANPDLTTSQIAGTPPGIYQITAAGTAPIIATSRLLVQATSLQDVTVAVPAGTVFQSNPPLLTMEYQYDMASTTNADQTSIDNVRITPGCYFPTADSDGDGDVDMNDFGAFQACFTGSLGTIPIALVHNYDCNCFDSNGDHLIDYDHDFTAFAACAPIRAHGAGVPGCH